MPAGRNGVKLANSLVLPQSRDYRLPFAPGPEHIAQGVDPVGDDPVDPEVQQVDHVRLVIDGPHVHMLAELMRPRHECLVDNDEATECPWRLDAWSVCGEEPMTKCAEGEEPQRSHRQGAEGSGNGRAQPGSYPVDPDL